MGAACRRWGHLLVLALVLPIALSSALPVFAHIVAGPTPDLCCCGMERAHCPRCNPVSRDAQLSQLPHCGRCGDQDAVLGGALGTAILPSSGVLVAEPSLAMRMPAVVSNHLAPVFLLPSTPPPRFVRS
jgi:hypothetical protein